MTKAASTMPRAARCLAGSMVLIVLGFSAAGPAAANEPFIELVEKPLSAEEAVAVVDEPAGYRTDGYRMPVPKTLTGAAVISTAEAETLHKQGTALFIDVYPRAPKPPNLPAGTLWRDPPHLTMPGATWLPNVGYGVLPPDAEATFMAQLEALSGGDKAKPLVFFCLRNCWMSWNAGKRAVAYGYTAVRWFPDGNDGWQEAGNDLAQVKPLP